MHPKNSCCVSLNDESATNLVLDGEIKMKNALISQPLIKTVSTLLCVVALSLPATIAYGQARGGGTSAGGDGGASSGGEGRVSDGGNKGGSGASHGGELKEFSIQAKNTPPVFLKNATAHFEPNSPKEAHFEPNFPKADAHFEPNSPKEAHFETNGYKAQFDIAKFKFNAAQNVMGLQSNANNVSLSRNGRTATPSAGVTVTARDESACSKTERRLAGVADQPSCDEILNRE